MEQGITSNSITTLLDSSQQNYSLVRLFAGVGLAFLPAIGRVTKVVTVANQTTYTGMSWFFGMSSMSTNVLALVEIETHYTNIQPWTIPTKKVTRHTPLMLSSVLSRSFLLHFTRLFCSVSSV